MKKQKLQTKVIQVEAPIVDLPWLSQWLTMTTNCSIVWRKDVAVVVDPGGEGERIVRFLKRRKLTVGAYWLTHAHPDHVGGLAELLDKFPAPVRYHRADSAWKTVSLPILSQQESESFQPFGNIRQIGCGDISAKVILTPGHTPGGVCYWFEDAGVVLSGDTLMQGCVGTTIYPGGDADDLNASLKRLFRSIPDDTTVIAGHDDPTTIAAERMLFYQPRKESKECETERKNKLKKPLLKRVFASTDDIEKAFNNVRRELENMNLLFDGSPLDKVDCWTDGILMGLGGAMGFYDFEDMDIHIPPVYPAGLLPQWFQERQLLDVLRHEFGHALADRYKKLFRGGIFKEAFGASYGEKSVFDGDDWTDEYVSEYASTATREDFAETFMLYIKHKGKMPARYRGKRVIAKKWKTVAQIVKSCARLAKSGK